MKRHISDLIGITGSYFVVMYFMYATVEISTLILGIFLIAIALLIYNVDFKINFNISLSGNKPNRPIVQPKGNKSVDELESELRLAMNKALKLCNLHIDDRGGVEWFLDDVDDSQRLIFSFFVEDFLALLDPDIRTQLIDSDNNLVLPVAAVLTSVFFEYIEAVKESLAESTDK